jgi:hypothetical protein
MCLLRNMFFFPAIVFGCSSAQAQRADRCADILRDGSFKRANLRESDFFKQIVYSSFEQSEDRSWLISSYVGFHILESVGRWSA